MFYSARQITFFQANQVENQNEPKRPQGGDRLGSFWFSTRSTAMGGTDYNALALCPIRLGSFWFSTRPTAMGGTDYNAPRLWDNLRSSSSICPIF